MEILITGSAGFIGSHLAERLLAEGHRVIGLDSFTDYYSRSIKEVNMASFVRHPRFTFVEGDLVRDLDRLPLDRIEVVYHLAAQAGVRASWGESFKIYTNANILATQVLHAVTYGAFHMASILYVDRRMPAAAKTLGQALNNALTYGLGLMAGFFLNGWLFERIGSASLFLVSAVIALAGGLLMAVAVRTSKLET